MNALRIAERPLEQLPLARDRFALTARLAHRFTHATTRLSERVYVDDWGLKASTTEVRHIVELGARWSIWPKIRLHLQEGVDFWKRAYTIAIGADGSHAIPALRTGDRELGPIASLGLGAGLRWDFGEAMRPTAWSATLQWEETRTHFFDALYVRDRNATLITLTVEVEL